MKRTVSRRALASAVVAMEPLDPRLFMDANGPAASLGGTGAISPGKPATTVQVFYSSNSTSLSPIQLSSIGTGDIVITGPNGFTETPVFVSANPATDSTEIVATYQFAAPGGFFDTADAGSYPVALQDNQVFDEAGLAATGGPLSSIFVPTLPATIVSTGPITGISVGADDRLQVINSQFNGGQFFSPSSFPGNAGVSIRIGTQSYGRVGTSFTPVSQIQSPDGLSITTVNNVISSSDFTTQLLQDTQVVSYQPGNPFFRVLNTIQNTTSSPETFDYFFAGDLYLADSDAGVGFFNASTMAVGGTDRTGNYNIFLQPDLETTQFTNYQEGPYSTIVSLPGGTQDYANTVDLPTTSPPYIDDTHFEDNGVGIEWKSITLDPGASTTLGFYAAFGNITTVATGPTATVTPVPDITASGTKSVNFTVTFNDGTTVNAASLTGDEIQVSGPNGFVQNATLVSTGLVNGNSVTATYQLTPPGGFPNSGNGTYTINYLANSAQDLQGNQNAGATLDTFNVNLPATPPVPVVAKVGGLDPTFGNGQGIAKVTLSNQKAVTAGIATEADGKLLVAATVTPAGGGLSDFEVFRLNTDGSLDTTFGAGGFARANFATSATARGIQLLKDGRILVIGSDVTSDGSDDFAFARFTSTGALDTSLNGTGRGGLDLAAQHHQASPSDDLARAVLVNPNGGFFIVGTSAAGVGLPGDFAIAKFKVDGSLDGSFNGGATLLDLGGTDIANAITLQKNGQVVVAGSTAIAGKPTRLAVARFNANGKVDVHFGVGTGKKGSVGFTLVPIGNSDDEAFAVTTLPNNNDILAGGFTATGSLASSNLTTNFALVALNPTGALEKSFGKGGKVVTNFAGQTLASITSLSVTTTAGVTRILASGKAASTLANGLVDSRSIAQARYQPNGALDPFFGTGGKNLLLQPDTLGTISDAPVSQPSLTDEFNSFTQDAEGAVTRTPGGGIRALASDNNITSTSVFVAAVVPDGVDLTGSIKTTGPATVKAGSTGSGTLTISNDGSLPVAAKLTVTFYASTDQDLSDDDKAFSTQVLPGGITPGKSKPYKVSYVFPKTLAAGKYFIIAKVNSAKKPVTEINFDNNEADSSKTITITAAGKAAPKVLTRATANSPAVPPAIDVLYAVAGSRNASSETATDINTLFSSEAVTVGSNEKDSEQQ